MSERPKFNTRHHEATAEALGHLHVGIMWIPAEGWVPIVRWKALVNNLTVMFEADNPGFDKDKFIKAVEKGV